MKLYINTANRKNKIIKLGKEEKTFGGDLLIELKKLFEESNVDLKEITEIEVNRGPGSFTSLRVGISIANTLNYVLGLKTPNEIITPDYGSEPNITL